MLRIKQFCSILLALLFVTSSGPSYAVNQNQFWFKQQIPISLTVSYLDVGQGDSILLKTRTHTVLIDGGSKEEMVVYKLQCMGVRTIDIIISTHPHEDHIGGLIDVMDRFIVEEVIDSGFDSTSKVYKDYLKYIETHHIKYSEGRDGEKRNIDGVEMTIINPAEPLKGEMNENSIALSVKAGRINYLFMADAGLTAEHQILKRYPNLDCTILKVGHHGSSGSTGKEFLYQIRPCEAIISVGENTYGHPNEEVLKRLKDVRARLYRTDQYGTITITTDGVIYTIQTERLDILDLIRRSTNDGKMD